MKLGKHFHLSEFCTSQTATRFNINMKPSDEVIVRLTALVEHILDPLREEIGKPIVVTSGWRPAVLNSLVGGSLRSQHLFGEAADITVPGVPVIEVCRTVRRLDLPFDQLIYEFGAWTHVSHRSIMARGEILTAVRKNHVTKYLPGLQVA